MFRYITTIFLLTTFAAQTFNQAVIVFDYYVNTASFAKNCENKALPKMHCNGQCQMMKKLREEQKKDQQHPERKAENKNEVSSSKSFFASLVHFKTSVHIPFASYDDTWFPLGGSTDVFHPPSLV